ncbi:hypothetical protein BC937DRAFT_87158 [Endogone sp. FLAS-F59071]|nr:hypothetical protein BC937DRAFT_87158 [Endogone sp. FLAS-F59071]|eukprot:RUS19647.1 hypothetical protein BC937DRAFT_87158 [Endogone sp. FLAS-F59071]
MSETLSFSVSRADKNSDVPDLAIVPRFSLSCFLVIPTPESVMVSVRVALSATIEMLRFGFEVKAAELVRERKRILSRASEALEMSSRRKISRVL